MQTQDFLRVVLPSAGHGLYCAMSGYTKKHFFAEQVEDLIPQFNRMVEQGENAYYALATFATDENRKAPNARYIRSLFIDMDGYDTPHAAWKTLVAFLKRLGLWELGRPYAVISGGGVHAYWPFTRDLEIAEWEPIARNFKRLCAQEKLSIDMRVTADAVRILRPPGTKNFKPDYPEPVDVEVVREGDTFDPQVLGDAIADLLTDEEPSNVIRLDIAGNRPTNATTSNITLFKNTTSLFKHLWDKTERGEGCQQLQAYIDNPTGKVEPLWRDLLSLARHCDDGYEYAIKLSDMHPYSPEEFGSKWAALVDQRPHLCKTFEESNPGGCNGCPHRENPRFRTPMNLTREVTTTDTLPDMEIAVPVASDVELGTVTRERPEAPGGYTYGENGGMFAIITIKEGKGKNATERTFEHPFLSYYLYPIEVLHDSNGYQSLRFRAEHPRGDRVFILTAADIATPKDAMRALTNNSVWADSKEDFEHLHRYLWACSSKASKDRESVLVATQLGWQSDGSFVFAGKKFTRGCKPVDIPVPEGLLNVTQATKPKGTIEGFKRVIQMLIAKRMYPQLAAIMLASGSPFMRFTGLHGLVVHCASKNSGTGKSVSLDVASAVWGDPLKYKLSKETSKVATQNRVGLLNSLPVTMDEVTMKTRGPEQSWFLDFLLSYTEGKGKDRLTQHAVERSNTTTWASIALLSSNTQCADMLLTREHASEGEIRRLLEIHMDDRVTFNAAETEIIQSLADHHGVVGYQMAQWLVDQDPEELQAKVRAMVSDVSERLHADGSERFWMAGLGSACMTAVLWKEMGFCAVPMKDGVFPVFQDTVKRLRAKMKSNARSAEDVLNSFVEQNCGNFLFVDKTDSAVSHLKMEFGPGVDRNRVNSLAGRVEHMPNGESHLIVTTQRITQHCTAMSFSVDQFRDELPSIDVGLEISKRKVGAHTRLPTPAVSCWTLKMKKARFDELRPGEDAVDAA